MITFVLCWLFTAVLVGFSGLLRTSALPMPSLSAAITLALLALLAVSRELRARALSAGIRVLLSVQLVRFFGVYFLWLSRQGLLPRDFAILAGWSPIILAIGALALLVVFRPGDERWRMAAMGWNVVGVLDILLMTAVMTRMAQPDPLAQGGFTSLPLSLVPTFIVPVIIVNHLLIFVWWFRERGQYHHRDKEDTETPT